MAATIPKSPFHAYCTSPIFKIIAGPEGDAYTVHSNLMEKSPVLEAVVNGEWKESSERSIRWEEWDSATVSMFVEWLYTGEYCCVYPVFVKRPEMEEGSKFTVVELWTTFDKIKQRKVVRDAKTQAAEARAYAHEDIKAQSMKAKTRAKKGRAQETKAGANELNTGGNKSKSETKIETPRAPPQAKCRAHTLNASATFHSEQLGHYDKKLSTAVVEKELLDGRIADIKRSIAEIGWKSDVRSAEVARNLERNVRARTIIIESSPCSPAGELETQKKMQQSLASPLPRLSFEFQSLSVDRITFSLTEGGFWDGLWGEHEKVALIQRHEDFGSWYGFKAHPLHSLDFTPSFLAHATLYALGQYTQIPLLRVNAFRALQVVLKSVHPMPPHSLAARGFAVLVQYVYTHVAAKEPLRELVASFAAWNHTILLLEQEYRWVMEGGGDFVLDLTELLARRLAV